jgi:hypothetical protein
MSASDQAHKRQGRTPAWQAAIHSGYYATLLAQARQAAIDGDRATVEALLVEIETALQSMPWGSGNRGGAWRRWLAQARHALTDRQANLSWAEYVAEVRRQR